MRQNKEEIRSKSIESRLLNCFLMIISLFYKPILNHDLAVALRFKKASVKVFALLAIFSVVAASIVIAGNVIVKDGTVNATGTEDTIFAGRVGIGTTSPNAKLHVVGDVNLDSGSYAYQIGGSSVVRYNGGVLQLVALGGGIGLAGDGSSNNLYVDPTGNINIGQGDLWVNTTTGNVGIGTTDPDRKLHVKNTVGETGFLVEIENGYGDGQALLVHASDGGSSDTQAILEVSNWDRTKPLLKVQGNGNVGIGTTSPETKLDLQDSSNDVILRLYAPSAKASAVQLRSNLGSYNWTFGVPFYADRFVIDESNVTNGDDFVIASGGNVGIGTTSPSQKLDVDGNIVATGTICDSGGTNCIGSGAGGVSGGGTTNYIPKWSGVSSLGDSVIYESGGNVGIGTTSPNTKLTINESSDNNAVISIGSGLNSPQYSSIDFYDRGNNTWGIGKDNNNNFYIDEFGVGTRFTIENNTGNVGIGTTSPGQQLSISNQNNCIIGLSSTNEGSETRLLAVSSNGRTESQIQFNGELRFISPLPPGDNIMILKQNGNVGIGTASPGATLEVKGTMKVFGAWESKAKNTVYQATTDGFVIATIICEPDRVYRLEGYTDSNNPPTTKRAAATDSAVVNVDWKTPSSFTMPVRKGHYWEVTGTSVYYSGSYTVTIYWIPLGS